MSLASFSSPTHPLIRRARDAWQLVRESVGTFQLRQVIGQMESQSTVGDWGSDEEATAMAARPHEGPLLNEGVVSGDALVNSLVDTASQALVKLAPMPLD